MFLKCQYCGYDSGDYLTMYELANKVIADGGKMTRTGGSGWYIVCPKVAMHEDRCEYHEVSLHLD